MILQEQIASCTKCRLATERQGLAVPAHAGTLYKTGGLALFLEAPGADEEKEFFTLPSGAKIGKPLVGAAGKLMNQLLQLAGVDREEVLVLNRIRCRPPRNRIIDYPDAVSQCDDWVIKELAEYEPHVILLSGATAAGAILGKGLSITAAAGSVRQTSDSFAYGKALFIPTFHPSYALRNGGLGSSIATEIVQHIKLAKALLEETN